MNLVNSRQLNNVMAYISDIIKCKGSVIADQQGLVIASDQSDEIDENLLALKTICNRKDINIDDNSIFIHSKISNDASIGLCMPKNYDKKDLLRRLSVISHKLAELFSDNVKVSGDIFQLLKISNPTPKFVYNRPCARSQCDGEMEVSIQFGQHTANRQYYINEEHFCPKCGYRKKDNYRVSKKMLSIFTI